jgi:hypothetical protein
MCRRINGKVPLVETAWPAPLPALTVTAAATWIERAVRPSEPAGPSPPTCHEGGRSLALCGAEPVGTTAQQLKYFEEEWEDFQELYHDSSNFVYTRTTAAKEKMAPTATLLENSEEREQSSEAIPQPGECRDRCRKKNYHSFRFDFFRYFALIFSLQIKKHFFSNFALKCAL